MPKAVPILLAFVLLSCPYICLGGHAVGGMCPHGDCDEACQLDEQHPTSGQHSCGECVHEVDSVPVERPVDDPRRSSQCQCQGALTCGEFRLPDVRVLHIVGFDALLPHAAADISEQPGRTGDDASVLRSAGRVLCVRVCALLI